MTPSSPTWDFASSLGIIGIFVVTSLGYLVRTALRGRARHARADKDGGSVVMGKPIIEYAYWVFEPVSQGLHRLGVTPDAVTAFSLVPGFLAGVAAAWGLLGVATVLAALAAFCDALDGLIARKRGKGSDAGEALDAAVDRYMEFFFQAGLVIHFRHEPGPLLVTLAAMLASFMISYTTAKAEAMGIDPPRGAMRRAERSVYMLFGAGFTPPWQFVVGVEASDSVWWREGPLILALVLVALIGHASALRRNRVLINRLRARDAAR